MAHRRGVRLELGRQDLVKMTIRGWNTILLHPGHHFVAHIQAELPHFPLLHELAVFALPLPCRRTDPLAPRQLLLRQFLPGERSGRALARGAHLVADGLYGLRLLLLMLLLLLICGRTWVGQYTHICGIAVAFALSPLAFGSLFAFESLTGCLIFAGAFTVGGVGVGRDGGAVHHDENKIYSSVSLLKSCSALHDKRDERYAWCDRRVAFRKIAVTIS